MPGKFVIKKGSTGKFRFSLHSTNGQIVATSEAYNTKAAAMGGIRSIQKIAVDAQIEDTTTREYAKAQEEAKAKKAARPRKAAAKKSSSRATKASRASKSS
ncbi:MAG TPA: YegP family protein [Acidimicrobiales bacterium]|nr:YegP family protein [Acidimicrobiales bacterium]